MNIRAKIHSNQIQTKSRAATIPAINSHIMELLLLFKVANELPTDSYLRILKSPNLSQFFTIFLF